LAAAAARSREEHRAVEPFGFERLSVFGLAVAMIAGLAAPAFALAATLLQVVCIAAIIALRWRMVPALLPAALPLLLLPLFAAASALWSDVPDISLRYGIQLLVTVIMGVALGRLLTLRQLVLAVFVGTSIACLVGLALGRTGETDGGVVLIGLSGSKNQMGYIALFWLSSALCVFGSSTYRPLVRILAGLAVLPASFLLIQADSATAIVSMAVLIGLLAGGIIL
jgi:exopolysaccharide production protein ExoQ